MGRVMRWAEIVLVVTVENLEEKSQRKNVLRVSAFGTGELFCVIIVDNTYLILELL